MSKCITGRKKEKNATSNQEKLRCQMMWESFREKNRKRKGEK